MFDSLKQTIAPIVQNAIQNQVFPGCTIGIVRLDGSREVLPFGKFTYEEGSQEVTADTRYDLASITKSIPTSSLALQLIDQGKLKLDDRLCDYIPEFRNSDRANVTIKHLLTYTIPGYGLASLGEIDPKKLEEILLTRDFDIPPGSTFRYTNLPAIFLGWVIERIHGKSLDELAHKAFFEPLGMKNTTYHIPENERQNVPPTEIDAHRGLVQGVVHDESAHAWFTHGKVMGHAGLFSSAGDILNFLEMLLHGGSLHGKTYFSESIMQQIESNQIPHLSEVTGLGWELYQPRYMGKFCTPKTFGKTGFTGTLCVCDRNLGIAYVILTNRIYPKRQPDATKINAFRAEIGNIFLDTADFF